MSFWFLNIKTYDSFLRQHCQRKNCFYYTTIAFGPNKWKVTEESTNFSGENLFKLHPTTNSIQVTL